MPQEINDDWVITWFQKNSFGDAIFLEKLNENYKALRECGAEVRAAFAATVRQHAIFADIKV